MADPPRERAHLPGLVADGPHNLRSQRCGWQARPGAVVGLLFIAYAYVRQKRVEEALARGEYAPFETRAGLLFAALGVMLGIGTITIILVQPG